jgi:hypothetical protein
MLFLKKREDGTKPDPHVALLKELRYFYPNTSTMPGQDIAEKGKKRRIESETG